MVLPPVFPGKQQRGLQLLVQQVLVLRPIMVLLQQPLVVRPSGGPTPGGQSSVNTRQSDQRYDNEQAFELRGWLKGLDDGAGAMVQYFDVLAFDDLSQNGYGPILKTNWKHSGRNH